MFIVDFFNYLYKPRKSKSSKPDIYSDSKIRNYRRYSCDNCAHIDPPTDYDFDIMVLEMELAHAKGYSPYIGNPAQQSHAKTKGYDECAILTFLSREEAKAGRRNILGKGYCINRYLLKQPVTYHGIPIENLIK